MIDTKKLMIEEYMQKLASKEPIPGGGGCAALNMALASSLISMVCNLTIGKKKFADVEEEIIKIRDRAVKKIEIFLNLSDEDAKVFLPLSKAYSLPSKSEKEKEIKDSKIEPLLVNAAKVPLSIIEESLELIKDLGYLVDNSSKLAISDIGVACVNIEAGLKASILNIKINTKYMKDRKEADFLENLSKEYIKISIEKLEKIYKKVYEVL